MSPAAHPHRCTRTALAGAVLALATAAALAPAGIAEAAAKCTTRTPCSTVTTISAPAKRLTTAPAFKITGKVTTKSGTALANRTVRVYAHAAGKKWSLVKLLHTGSKGTWSVSTRPSATSYYKAVFSSTTKSLRGSTSRTVTTRVTKPAAPPVYPAYAAPTSAVTLGSCRYAVKWDADIEDDVVNAIVIYNVKLTGGSWWRLLPGFGFSYENHDKGQPFSTTNEVGYFGNGITYEGPSTKIVSDNGRAETLVWAPGEHDPAKYKSVYSTGPFPTVQLSSCTRVASIPDPFDNL